MCAPAGQRIPIDNGQHILIGAYRETLALMARVGVDASAALQRLVLGGRTSTHKAVVQCAGTAWRLRAEVMAWELNQHGHLLRLALCYTQALMTQMAQSVVCNRHHAVD